MTTKELLEKIAKILDGEGTPDQKLEAIKRLDDGSDDIVVKESDLRQAFPMLLATVGAALLGASAEKGSPLRYAGAVPGLIDLFAKSQAKRDSSELVISLGTAAAGGAAPALIK